MEKSWKKQLKNQLKKTVKKSTQKSEQKNILLLDIHPNKIQTIQHLLKKEDHVVHQVTFPEYKKNSASALPPHLVIVDVHHQNIEVIQSTKQQLTKLYQNELNPQLKPLPPILAFVDVGSRHKQQLFHQGVADYISYPLIEEEFKRRVQYALFSGVFFQIQHKEERTNEEQSSFIKPIKLLEPVNADLLLVEKTVAYLTKNLDTDIKLNELSLKMGTNRTKLTIAFKDSFGLTVMHWFCEQCMLYAAELLKNTSKSIVEIAEQVGYQYQSHFTFAFKRQFNITPKGYRTNYCR